MNTRNASRIFLSAAAVFCLGLFACQTNREAGDSPGALPRANGGITPRINAATYAAHGELLERRGEYQRAAEQYRKALEVSPDLLTARNRLGVTLNKLGQHAEATEEFRKAISLHPELAYLHNNLGFSLYLQNDLEAAEAVLARAVELEPDFRRARMNHALVLARLARFDAALDEFAQAGTTGDAYYNVGVIQAQMGRYVEASRSFEAALENDPGLDAARDQLRDVARLAAAHEAAESAAKALALAAAAEQKAAPETPASETATLPEDTGPVVADEPTTTSVDAATAVEESTAAKIDAEEPASEVPTAETPADDPVLSEDAAFARVATDATDDVAPAPDFELAVSEEDLLDPDAPCDTSPAARQDSVPQGFEPPAPWGVGALRLLGSAMLGGTAWDGAERVISGRLAPTVDEPRDADMAQTSVQMWQEYLASIAAPRPVDAPPATKPDEAVKPEDAAKPHVSPRSRAAAR